MLNCVALIKKRLCIVGRKVLLSTAVVMVGLSGLVVEPAFAQSEAKVAKPAAQTVLIDVRTPQEFSDQHLKGAINIEYQDVAFKIASVVPDKNTPIELYCRSGKRSGIAEEALRGLGYTHITNMGGLESLIQQGKPVAK